MSTQVAVRLDSAHIDSLDWLVARGSFNNRTDVIRSAIELMAVTVRERELDAAIVEGYKRIPQTDAESSWSSSNDWSALHDDDWSDWK